MIEHAESAYFSEVLATASDASSVLTFVTVVFLAFWGGRARVWFIASRKARLLLKVPEMDGMRLARRRGLRRQTRRRIWDLARVGERWSVSREITWLSRLDPRSTRSQLVWDRPSMVPGLVTQLAIYLRFLETSFIARVGSPQLADEEAVRTRRVIEVLRQDADFSKISNGRDVVPDLDLSVLNVEMLAGPSWSVARSDRGTSQRNSFDAIRVSSSRRLYGAPGPMRDPESKWRCGEEVSADLHSIAQKIGRDLKEKHPDAYNGVLPRLLGAQVESSRTGPVRRLHLNIERTTFLTWLATNGNAALPNDLKSQLRGNDSSDGIGANHIPVTVSLVSSDGYLVLPQRATDIAVYPGSYGCAANGNVEIIQRMGGESDLDVDGFVDFAGAAARECREELGPQIDIDRESIRAFALFRYSDQHEFEAPVLAFGARSGQTLAEIVSGIDYAHPVEGAFEMGDTVLAIPTSGGSGAAEIVRWMRAKHAAKELTAAALVSSLLTLAQAWGPERVAEGMAGEYRHSDVPAGVRIEVRSGRR